MIKTNFSVAKLEMLILVAKLMMSVLPFTGFADAVVFVVFVFVVVVSV